MLLDKHGSQNTKINDEIITHNLEQGNKDRDCWDQNNDDDGGDDDDDDVNDDDDDMKCSKM